MTRADVVQSVERLFCKQVVAGSNPVVSSSGAFTVSPFSFLPPSASKSNMPPSIDGDACGEDGSIPSGVCVVADRNHTNAGVVQGG